MSEVNVLEFPPEIILGFGMNGLVNSHSISL